MSSKMYRINVNVTVTEEKQKELLAVLKEKKSLNSVHDYFTQNFTKVLERAAQEIQRSSSAKSLTSKLFYNDIMKDTNDYIYNFGVQGVYDELMEFLENQYVHSVFKFITPYSKSKMYKPYDNDKKPYGDYYVHVGEGGFNYNLPHMKHTRYNADGGFNMTAPMKEVKAETKVNPLSFRSADPLSFRSTVLTKDSSSETSSTTKRSSPPCQLEIVSRSLADKMRKIKEVEAQSEQITKTVHELLEKQKTLKVVKGELKEGLVKLKKQLNNLMKEDDSDEKEEWTAVEVGKKKAEPKKKVEPKKKAVLEISSSEEE